MKRLLSAALMVTAIGLAADKARAQAPATVPSVVAVPRVAAPAGYYYYNGYYYARPAYVAQPYTYPGTGTRTDSLPGYYSHNGVLRGPSGAMTGRVRHDFDPTGRGVQLYKPWLQPIR